MVLALDIGVPFLLLAFTLGLLHGIEPGHGKVVIAAYALSKKSRLLKSISLSFIVAGSHLALVFAVAVVAIFIGSFLLSGIERALKVGVGVATILIGFYMLRRLRIRHDHEHGHNDIFPIRTVEGKNLVSLGISGGLQPCPAALALVIAAVAESKLLIGLQLLAVFSVGMMALGLSVAGVTSMIHRLVGEKSSFYETILTVGSTLIVLSFGVLLIIEALGNFSII